MYGNTSYYLQSVYAESHEALSPGTLMTWLPIQSALATKRARFNMLPDFSYYEVALARGDHRDRDAADLPRRSRYQLKAVLGDFRRKIHKGLEAGKVLKNPYKVAAGKPVAPVPGDRAKVEALAATARDAGAMVLDTSALAALSPFA